MGGYVQHKTPAVTYVSTLSGAIGSQALRRFYDRHFLGRLPPSMRIRLLSRTAGSDRVVDELYISFEHTHEIPWMLPGVPPTHRRVEIILVSIVSLRAGRLYSEHTYWDQASVLVQVGLLDPKLVPGSVEGVDRLPVVGREAARRILHEDPEIEQENYHNRLIRRANARARKGRSSRTSQVAEGSGAESKNEVEPSLPVRGGQGKTVQESRPAGPQRTATEMTEYTESYEHADVDEGAVTETESRAKSKSDTGDRSAYVEEEKDEDGDGQ